MASMLRKAATIQLATYRPMTKAEFSRSRRRSIMPKIAKSAFWPSDRSIGIVLAHKPYAKSELASATASSRAAELNTKRVVDTNEFEKTPAVWMMNFSGGSNKCVSFIRT